MNKISNTSFVSDDSESRLIFTYVSCFYVYSSFCALMM